MDADLAAVLKDLYYKPESPASFGSALTLKYALSQKGLQVPLKTIDAWLKEQYVHQLHSPARKNYPTRRIIVPEPNYMWESDIMTLAGFEPKYLLFNCIVV